MSIQDYLDKQRDKLLEIAKNGDKEIAHADADDLLLEIIDYLAHAAGGDASEITDAYDNEGKWYS